MLGGGKYVGTQYRRLFIFFFGILTNHKENTCLLERRLSWLIVINNHNMCREWFYHFSVRLKYKKNNIDFLPTNVYVAFGIQYNRAILLLGRNYIENIDTGSPLFTTSYHYLPQHLQWQIQWSIDCWRNKHTRLHLNLKPYTASSVCQLWHQLTLTYSSLWSWGKTACVYVLR